MRIHYYLLMLTFGVLLTGTPLRAQLQSQSTAPYVIVKTSYGFSAGPQLINQAEVNLGGKRFTSGIYGSYAKGVQFSLGVGKMLNSTLGVELNAQYLLGSPIRTDYNEAQDNIIGHQTERIRGLLITPLIVLRNSGDLLTIYSKLGPTIALVSNRSVQQELRYQLDGQSYFIVNDATEKAKPKVGLAACFGLSFRISESVSFFVEANGQILSLPIMRGKYTRFEANGTNKLPSMSTNDKSWVYERAGFLEDNPDSSKPETRLYTPAYYSSVGVGTGIIYHFP